jgi:hypothetical protein
MADPLIIWVLGVAGPIGLGWAAPTTGDKDWVELLVIVSRETSRRVPGENRVFSPWFCLPSKACYYT